MPIPPPMHIVANAYCPPVRWSRLAAFPVIREPLAPRGCPIASAPPSTLILESSILRPMSFHDDVAIRIFESGKNVIIWLQSQSRLGLYDFNVNERRIQKLHDRISVLK